MEDKLSNKTVYNDNNFPCTSYWQYKDGESEPLKEPEMKKAQYEMGIKETEYGNKLWIKIFSRVGKESSHKRDFYKYIEFPVESRFSWALRDILSDNLMLGSRT